MRMNPKVAKLISAEKTLAKEARIGRGMPKGAGRNLNSRGRGKTGATTEVEPKIGRGARRKVVPASTKGTTAKTPKAVMPIVNTKDLNAARIASPDILNTTGPKGPVGPRIPKSSVERVPGKKYKDSEWQRAGIHRDAIKKDKALINQHVKAGLEAPPGTAIESMRETAGDMWGRIKDTGFAGGDYTGSAISGAAVMGTISGTNEWANGGSFWSGFKSGAVTGAVGGAALKGARVGAYGKNYASHSLGDSVGHTAKNFYAKERPKVSNALKTLQKNAQMNNINLKVMNSK